EELASRPTKPSLAGERVGRGGRDRPGGLACPDFRRDRFGLRPRDPRRLETFRSFERIVPAHRPCLTAPPPPTHRKVHRYWRQRSSHSQWQSDNRGPALAKGETAVVIPPALLSGGCRQGLPRTAVRQVLPVRRARPVRTSSRAASKGWRAGQMPNL